MALAKGTNSYVTLAEATTYFGDRLDAGAWDDADDARRSQALVTATEVLDGQSWTGTAVSDSQPLAFPRVGNYFDPRIGTYQSLPATVPDRVVKATYELAYHLLNNDGILDDTGQVIDLQVGTIQLTKVSKPNLIPAVVTRLIRPLLVNAGSNVWWRAN